MKTLVASAAIGVLLLFVWERVDLVRVGYHIEQLKTKKAALLHEQDELRVRVSSLTAPDRIARAATDKLGMIPPQPGQVVMITVAQRGNVTPPEPQVQLARQVSLRRP